MQGPYICIGYLMILLIVPYEMQWLMVISVMRRVQNSNSYNSKCIRL